MLFALARVTSAYDGHELNEEGHIEQGYLALRTSDRIQILGSTAPGHTRNRYSLYAFCLKLSHPGTRGWCPVDCLKLLQVAAASAAYDAVEITRDGSPEQGYLALSVGDRVQVISRAKAGHQGNRYAMYVFAHKVGSPQEHGWCPTRNLCSLADLQHTLPNLGSRPGKRPVQHVPWNRDPADTYDDSDDESAEASHELVNTTLLHSRLPAGNLVLQTIVEFLGEPWFRCRSVCRRWAKHGFFRTLPLETLRVKLAAAFDRSAPVAIIRCIAKLPSVTMIRLPFRGGCLQRIRVLQLARQIHEQSPQSLRYVLEGFFGFLDADAEADEMAELAALQASGMRITSESGFEMFPGASGRVFVSNLFESEFYTVAHCMHFEFDGGSEDLSVRIKSCVAGAMPLVQITYEIVSVKDHRHEDEDDDEEAGSLGPYIHLTPLETRINKVHVSELMDIDLVLPPFGEIELPDWSIPIQPFAVWNDAGFSDRLSLFQRLQVSGQRPEWGDEKKLVLASTGWMHIAGPDGSEGATIVAPRSNEYLLDFKPLTALVQKATGNLDLVDVENGCDCYQSETRISHVVQFRTQQLGDQFQSIVHVNVKDDCGGFEDGLVRVPLDLFVLGTPCDDCHTARMSAAAEATRILQGDVMET